MPYLRRYSPTKLWHGAQVAIFLAIFLRTEDSVQSEIAPPIGRVDIIVIGRNTEVM